MQTKIGIIGSCQVVGMKSCAQRLMPDAHIEAHVAGQQYDGNQLRELLRGYDLIISQVRPVDQFSEQLAAQNLTDVAKKAIYCPTFVFGGLHPDLTYLFPKGQIFKGAYSDMHSMLVAGSFALGLSARRAERLFNTYIFAEVGYFDAFEAARDAMLHQFNEIGIDMAGAVERWLDRSGAFMHTMNHPSIAVLSEMTTECLRHHGVISPDSKPPEGVLDDLALSFTAPIFTPIAKRLGIPSRDHFLLSISPDRPRELSLRDYIEASYELYEDCGLDFLMGDDDLKRFCEKLAPLLSTKYP